MTRWLTAIVLTEGRARKQLQRLRVVPCPAPLLPDHRTCHFVPKEGGMVEHGNEIS
jgi:hypothetical protein